MLDRRLRPLTNDLLAVPARSIGLDPVRLTLLGMVIGLASAVFASQEWWLAALCAFVANRLLDGLDGAVSRQRSKATDAGAYLDVVADTIVYVAVPLGVAFGHDRETVWVASALLLGSFAFNLISWSHLSALLERRRAGAGVTGELTGVTMPRGLVEGTETIVWFVLFLAFPQWIVMWMVSMAVAVAVGAVKRVRHGMVQLESLERVASGTNAVCDG